MSKKIELLEVWGEYKARYVSNYDGDSVTIQFEIWHKTWKESAVRLGGIDTPEIGHRAKCDRELELGLKAQQFVERMMSKAEVCKVRVYKREKFGRLLVDLSADDVDVATELIKNGLAVPYYGGKRKTWC